MMCPLKGLPLRFSSFGKMLIKNEDIKTTSSYIFEFEHFETNSQGIFMKILDWN